MFEYQKEVIENLVKKQMKLYKVSLKINSLQVLHCSAHQGAVKNLNCSILG